MIGKTAHDGRHIGFGFTDIRDAARALHAAGTGIVGGQREGQRVVWVRRAFQPFFQIPRAGQHVALGIDQVPVMKVLDLREEETIYAGNRFMIYALYPDTNISIHVMWGMQKMNTVFATGKSILNRTSNTNVGELMLKYGGGGHLNAGTCQVENDEAEKVLGELVEQINADG